MKKIKPCPFCGGEPTTDKDESVLFCSSCGACPFQSGDIKDDEDSWNMRIK